jgi:peptide-methionine (S)-S-oxide reductase
MAYAAERASKGTEGAKATFAGGCFWSVERFFDKVDGVLSTTSGFTGGAKKNPTYDEVVTGTTGHAEAVQVTYDPKKVSYEKLLEVFWRNIDPLTPNGQFCDFGSQYRTAIFYQNETEKRLAETSRKALQGRFKQPIVTQVVAASQFYPAEDYHQDFHLKNPTRYQMYRIGCGRDRRLEEIWGAAAQGKSQK